MKPSGNQLLARLRPRARDSLMALAEAVPLALSQVLAEAGALVAHVYFPVEGFISLVAVVDESPGIEVGMVGSEGMLGATLALEVATSPVRAIVQGAGTAWRVPASGFRDELTRNPQLRRAVCRYLYVLLCQQASSAVCLRFHPIGPRLARWLLMTQDRAHSPDFRVTHEFLAYMLGVRREGITEAAGVLQQQSLITYRRGEMRILDRRGLEAAACGCYAAARAIHSEILD